MLWDDLEVRNGIDSVKEPISSDYEAINWNTVEHGDYAMVIFLNPVRKTTDGGLSFFDGAVMRSDALIPEGDIVREEQHRSARQQRWCHYKLPDWTPADPAE